MREYKYRAWHKTLKEMFIVAHLHFGIDGLRKIETSSISSDSWQLSDMELMQYTGLKDCKGNEIYEGDIVKVDSGLEELRVSRVGFKQGCFVFQSINSPKFSTMALFVGFGDTMEYIEIIGNRYEHPHLMEVNV